MDLLELFQYSFFQYALWGSLFASIACGIIGTYIVTRRLVFISGGITHASFGGIGIGLYAGISPLLSAAVFSVLSAFGVELAEPQERYARRFCNRCILDFWNGYRYYIQLSGTWLYSRFVFLSFWKYHYDNPRRYLCAGCSYLWFWLYFSAFSSPYCAIAFEPRIALSQKLAGALF